MKAIIMAAGKSTRTYPLTLTRPKPLLPFLKGTILSHMLDKLEGFDEAIIIVNYKKEMIEKEFGNKYKNIKLTYVDQKEPKGTGHAVLMAKEFVDENVVIMNGDDIYAPETINELMKTCPSIAVREVKTPKLYGIFEYKEKNGEKIAKSLEEKPENPKSNCANIGLYYFGKEFFKYLNKLEPSPRGELELTDAIKMYMQHKDIRLVKAEPYWLPVGHPWDLLTATERLIDKNILQSEVANVKCCSVIGRDVKIGKGTVIENSLIFDGARIGNNCSIVNSIIGAKVRIGNNFKTLCEAKEIYSAVKDKMVKVNRRKYGVTIGDGAILGDNVVTHPGVKIWPKVKVEGEVVGDANT